MIISLVWAMSGPPLAFQIALSAVAIGVEIANYRTLYLGVGRRAERMRAGRWH